MSWKNRELNSSINARIAGEKSSCKRLKPQSVTVVTVKILPSLPSRYHLSKVSQAPTMLDLRGVSVKIYRPLLLSRQKLLSRLGACLLPQKSPCRAIQAIFFRLAEKYPQIIKTPHRAILGKRLFPFKATRQGSSKNSLLWGESKLRIRQVFGWSPLPVDAPCGRKPTPTFSIILPSIQLTSFM